MWNVCIFTRIVLRWNWVLGCSTNVEAKWTLTDNHGWERADSKCVNYKPRQKLLDTEKKMPCMIAGNELSKTE